MYMARAFVVDQELADEFLSANPSQTVMSFALT